MEKLFTHTGMQSQAVEIKKTGHKKQILRSLFLHGSLSNSELSHQVKLSTPKINSLLNELIQDGLVHELGRGDSSGGRRPNIYGLIADGFYVAGITININRSIISVFDASNQQVSGPHYLPVKIRRDMKIFRQVSSKLQEVLDELNIDRTKVLATGIELPGLINQKAGINKTYFPEVDNLFGKLGNIFGMPVYVNHDSKVRAFAEQQFGLARGVRHALLVHVDWGVGLGIIINGKLYGGKSGYSGEFGHLPVAGNDILCGCGKRGCLETIVSATAIARQATEHMRAGKQSLINNLVKDDPLQADFSVVLQAANLGDQFAISLFTDAGYRLGQGIAYLLQLFNPGLIILGGKVAEAQAFISAPIQQAVNTWCNRDISNDTEIKFSTLGTHAGTLGAAAFAMDQVLSVK